MSSNKDFVSQQLVWIGIYLVIALAISFIVPFPYSFPVIVGVVLILGIFVRRKMFNKMSRSGAGMFGGLGSSSVRYYCMNCGTKHNEIACPKCGSKMKRIGG
jgi:hypothetical protein